MPNLLAIGVLLAAIEPSPEQAPKTDLLTIVAIGATSYVTAALIHEGVGHELGCALGGGRPIGFSMAVAGCDGETNAGHRITAASGVAANLAVGSGLLTSLALTPPSTGAEYFSVWLSGVVNMHMAGGYMMIGPWVPAGDWGSEGFVRDLRPRLPYQIGISALGLGITATTLFLGNHLAEPLLGAETETRASRQWTTTLVPYLVGATLVTSSALLTRAGPEFAVSAAVANFAGTLFLAYVPLFFSDDFFYPGGPSRPPTALAIEHSTPWLVIGTVAALASVFVFGPGLGNFDKRHPFDPS